MSKLSRACLVMVVVALAACGGGGGSGGDAAPPVANIAPVANAGAAQSVTAAAIVTLNGSSSSDANADPLTYSWTLTSRPTGSAATLAGATSAAPTFTADLAGAYIASLTVNDGKVNSAVSTVTINAVVANVPPIANAGVVQNVVAGTLVTLNGSASSDANGDLLTYSWSLIGRPAGSTAALASATSARPTITADLVGTYVASLTVNDGKVNSTAATVTVTATVANVAPVAIAGVAQNVIAGTLVTLDGSASSDANGDLLTYSWSLINTPAGSAAALTSAISARPTLTTDLAGTYIASLTVNDGKVNSTASTVTVTAAPRPPPTPLSFNLSGTITVAQTTAVDSDLNDARQTAYRVNDSISLAQAVQTPLLLVGTVNKAFTGPAGNNYTLGDADDYFVADLVAGQVVELEFGTDPAQADVDLFVIATNGASIGSSQGTTARYECVRVSTTGRYYINVYAFKSASIYNLRIAAPGSAGSCATATVPLSVAPGELLAKARAVDAATAASQGARLVVQGDAASEQPIPRVLRVPRTVEARAAALSSLAGSDAGRGAARRLSTLQAPAGGAARPWVAEEAHESVSLLKIAKELQAGGAFDYVQPNWLEGTNATIGLYPPTDRGYPAQRWHYDQINLPSAMSLITQLPSQPSQRPLVAVIDDGVMLSHPDIQPQLYSSGRSFITNLVDGDGNSTSGDNPAVAADSPVFHGTHVAGTVGAATFDGVGGAGTAPMALLLPLRVFPPRSGARQSDIINAMLYAARLSNNSGFVPARRADVINLSLGGARPCDAAYRDAVDRVRVAGVFVVAAAGNDAKNANGVRADVGAPANCPGAYAVSALNATRGLASYSNTGSSVVVTAPGGDASQSTTGTGLPDGIFSALGTFDGNGVRQPSFGPSQGTSMAAPHVSGVMALMRYVNPGMSVSQVDALMAQGALTDDIGTTGWDSFFGYGLINARKAVAAALAATASPPATLPVGVVRALPAAIDFGSFQTSAALELSLTAAGTETVVGISSDSSLVTVAAASINTSTRLGAYTVNVNRLGLSAGSIFPRLTVTLSTGRSLVVPLTVTQLPAGAVRGGNAGPLLVLLFDPNGSGRAYRSVLATRGSNGYTWSTTAWPFAGVQVGAGADLDGDNRVCERGEPCGAFPVLGAGGGLSTITLTGNRSDINFEVAPLAGISPSVVRDEWVGWDIAEPAVGNARSALPSSANSTSTK